MNSKAIKRQLLAAIAMVLVAAIALGSSTYAWFVASGSVTAEGMTVTAQGESGLLIRYDGGQWGSIASAGMSTAKALFPASTADLAKWSHATALAAGSKTADSNTFTDITGNVFVSNAFTDNAFVLMKEFEIQSSSASIDTKGLCVSNITVKNTDNTAVDKTMSTALRVGVIYTKDTEKTNAPGAGTAGNGDSQFYIFAPVTLNSGANNTPTTSYTIQEVTGSGENKQLTERNVTAIDTVSNQVLIGESQTIPSDGSGIKVQIFIWFEGEDDNLFTNNFNVEDLAVSVEFSCLSDAGTTV